MNKRLKILIENIKSIFSIEFLDKVARKTGFIKRNGKITAENFLAFNTFSSDDMCDKSLSTLCARLSSQFNTDISPQALNDRFNEYSVKFMQEVFKSMMIKQNKILSRQCENLYFNRILINDSTAYGLPEQFHSEFKGHGGARARSAIKIQLQYDLISGGFSCCEAFSSTSNDANYVDTMDKHTHANDLRLADLGYYNVGYLKKIHEKDAFFISKLRSTSAIYIKNPNPKKKLNGKILKSTEYIKIDIFDLIKELLPGKTIEIKDIYIGSQKELKSRLIITKLSEENKKKREIKHLKAVKRKRASINDRSLAWNEINVYITNVPEKVLSAEEVHDVYSLRWQIEIMFKIWKSIFNINNVKPVKIERFKCFLYGRLIALLLSSAIVFTARDIVYEDCNKEISELKSFSHTIEFFENLRSEIFKGELALLKLFKRIIATLSKVGIKSKKKGRKSVIEIVNYLKIPIDELEVMVV